MKTFLSSLTTLVILPASVYAQSVPTITQGQVPTISQWQGYFSGKVDVTNGTLTNPTISGGLTVSTGDLVVSAGGLQSTKSINYGTGNPSGPTYENLKISGALSGICNDPTQCTINFLSNSSDNVFSGSSPLYFMWIEYQNSAGAAGSRWIFQLNTNANVTDSSYGTTWTSGTLYAAGALVHPPAGGASEGDVYENLGASCTAGATQPTGTAVSGISDGGCTDWGYLYSNSGYGSMRITTTVKATGGGLDTTSVGSYGTNFAFNPAIRGKSGATNLTAMVSQENDCSMAAGSSTYKFSCVQFVIEAAHAVPGTHVDQILALTAQSGAVGVRNAFVIGEPTSQEPWAAGGTLIGAYLGSNWGNHNTAAGVGLDFKDVTFTDYSALLPHAGFDPTGGELIGHAYLSTNSTGASLDTTGRETTGAGVSTGGSGCANNDLLESQYHGVWKVTQTGTGGAASQVSEVIPGRYNGASPPTTATTTARGASNCSGVVLAPTWESAQNKLQLNNSGGETDVGGGLVVGSSTLGGYQGSGTVNAHAYYQDGSPFTGGGGGSGAPASTRIIGSGTTDTATSGDFFIGWASNSSGTKTENIPACSSSLKGQVLVIFDDNGSSGTITVTPANNNIDGAASESFSNAHGGRAYICDGINNWAGWATR